MEATDTICLGDILHVLTEEQIGQTFPVPKQAPTPPQPGKRVINTTQLLEENTQHFKG